eukprot:9353300-Alexandrium_andersonii.AAC.1
MYAVLGCLGLRATVVRARLRALSLAGQMLATGCSALRWTEALPSDLSNQHRNNDGVRLLL